MVEFLYQDFLSVRYRNSQTRGSWRRKRNDTRSL